jgi:CRISPR-associated protein Cas5d
VIEQAGNAGDISPLAVAESWKPRTVHRMSNYSVQIEIAGPLAMFARPDTGGTPTSYPAPTWSAAKGILESIAFLSSGEATLHPNRIEVCRLKGTRGGAVEFQSYATNYGGPLRKDLNIKNGTAM